MPCVKSGRWACFCAQHPLLPWHSNAGSGLLVTASPVMGAHPTVSGRPVALCASGFGAACVCGTCVMHGLWLNCTLAGLRADAWGTSLYALSLVRPSRARTLLLAVTLGSIRKVPLLPMPVIATRAGACRTCYGRHTSPASKLACYESRRLKDAIAQGTVCSRVGALYGLTLPTLCALVLRCVGP